MLEFTDTNFQTQVLDDPGLVLADFWAAWCRPCHALSPTLERVENSNPSVKVGKVNIDENPETTAHFQINAVPTVLLFKGGELVKRFVGLQNEAVFTEVLNENA